MIKTINKIQKTTTTPQINPFHLLKNLTPIFILLLATTACASAKDQTDYSDDEIRTLLPFDAIPAITEPQFVSAGAAQLDADAPIIGVTFNDESHAYSLYLLNGHEIVNAVVGGLNIATTW